MVGASAAERYLLRSPVAVDECVGAHKYAVAINFFEGYIDAHAGQDAVTHRPFRWQLDWIFSKDLPPVGGEVINTGRASDHLPLWASLGPG